MDKTVSNIDRGAAIETFKQIGYLVFEISKEEVITNVWSKSAELEAMIRKRYVNTRMEDARNDKLISLSLEATRRAFSEGTSDVIEYTTIENDVPVKILLKIVPDFTNPNY